MGVQEVSIEDVSKYGIIDPKFVDERVYKVMDLIEKPKDIYEAPSNAAILGRYILTPSIFDVLAHQEPGKGGEIQLTDALKQLSKYEDIYAYDFEGKRYDVGDKLGFLEANIDFALKNPEIRKEFFELMKRKFDNIGG